MRIWPWSRIKELESSLKALIKISDYYQQSYEYYYKQNVDLGSKLILLKEQEE